MSIGADDLDTTRGGARRDPSLLGMLNVVLRHRLLIGGLAFAVGLLWVVLALLAPRTYTSTVAFVAQARSPGGALPGVVAQLGINLGGSEGTASPEFYVDLVRSRPILLAIARDTFDYRDDAGRTVRGSLAGLYDIPPAPAALAHEGIIRRLRQDVVAGSNIKTGVITVRVTAIQPEVAHQLAERLFAAVHEYNITSRQRQAAADRRFTEQRMAEQRMALREAEDRVQSFMDLNRNAQAPRLTLQLERLQREVAMQQTLYMSLAQSYGQAKMEELRDTPALTTVEAPEVPVLPDKRGLPVKLFIGLLLGTMLGLIFAFLGEYFRRSRRASPDDFEEFAQLRRAAVDDVLHPWRPVGRAIRGRRSR